MKKTFKRLVAMCAASDGSIGKSFTGLSSTEYYYFSFSAPCDFDAYIA